jgi:hypothetical protein
LITSTTIMFAAMISQCKPLDIVHAKSFENGHCFPPTTLRSLGYVNSSVRLFAETVFAFLPILVLWHVQIDRKVKLRVMLILSLSSL